MRLGIININTLSTVLLVLICSGIFSYNVLFNNLLLADDLNLLVKFFLQYLL